jgi:hypothetical protein
MKVGITGYHSDLDGVADFFEIDAHDLDSQTLVHRRKAPSVLSANHFFFTHSDSEIFRDRIELLATRAEKIRSHFCLLKLPPRFFERNRLEDVLGSFQTVWKNHSDLDVVVDLPQESPRGILNRLEDRQEWSTDPLWQNPRKTKCWKVHGWHDARWIRLYAESDLVRLAKHSKKLKPEYLIFGHSQRVVQIKQFLDLGGDLADAKQQPKKKARSSTILSSRLLPDAVGWQQNRILL